MSSMVNRYMSREKVMPIPFSPSCDVPTLQWVRSSSFRSCCIVRAVQRVSGGSTEVATERQGEI